MPILKRHFVADRSTALRLHLHMEHSQREYSIKHNKADQNFQTIFSCFSLPLHVQNYKQSFLKCAAFSNTEKLTMILSPLYGL